MKKLSLLLIGLFLIPSLFLTSCDEGEDPLPGVEIKPAFTVLKDYMIDKNLDINNIIGDKTAGTFFVVAPPADDDQDAINAFLAKYHIVDIRTADAHNTSHIEGAKNVAFANILAEGAAAGDKPILVVCYSGQTACYATALLRLYGYMDTKALKWGMSGWSPETATSWNNQIGKDEAHNHANWTGDGEPTPSENEDPFINIYSQNGEEILKAQVEATVALGFKNKAGTDVLNSTPGEYYINNYFSTADYTGFGHIDGAYRVLPLTLADDIYKALDPDKEVITYCYTGQTSAVVTACLNVLGYDAYSMLFGMNGIYNTNSAWKTNQWGVGSSNPKNLPLK